MEPDLTDAVGDYLLAHIERHGHARTAEAFGVSRHTLWRFLERGQPGRALPRAVMARAGDTPRKLAAATRALAGETRPAPLERSRAPRLTQALQETLLLVCETPFASVEDLARMKRLPATSLRERLAKLRRLGLAEAHPHRLAMLSDRPLRRESGDKQPQLRITKEGDVALRRVLTQAAHYVLGPFGPDTDLRRWRLRYAESGAGNAKKRAVVAVARRLAVLMLALWKSGEA